MTKREFMGHVLMGWPVGVLVLGMLIFFNAKQIMAASVIAVIAFGIHYSIKKGAEIVVDEKNKNNS